VLGFLAYLPHSKHLHIAPPDQLVLAARARALELLDFTTEDEATMPVPIAT
jgi:hypothetical protein